MKNIINKISKPLLFGFLIITLFGCEDIIEVELNSANPIIVIEAAIAGNNSKSIIKITKSTDFYKPGVYEKISNAEISINDDEGNSVGFTEISEGIYESLDIIGKTNVEYLIEVTAEGESYNAVSTMPNKIILDSLSLEAMHPHPGEKESTGFILIIYFQDPPNTTDYCRFKLYKNGNLLGGFYIYEDRLTNGNYISYRLPLNVEGDKIELGDKLTVELLTIDAPVFEYYKTANSINASGSARGGAGSSSSTPANPVTNWSNKALGVFSAYTVSSDSISIVR
ncbi:MAG: DUF4249 domain-containing protein [Melioribacteraceae bacterium]|nr:DUF4249 domain-containing protein [Melioribacteraceae bacterium]